MPTAETWSVIIITVCRTIYTAFKLSHTELC